MNSDVRYTSVVYGYKTCDINSKVFLPELLLSDIEITQISVLSYSY